jgi:hypothetical protein
MTARPSASGISSRSSRPKVKSAQMFCEITLGQLLGLNPGDAGKGFGAPDHSPHADYMPKQRVEEFRRYYGWRDELIDAVRNGARSPHLVSDWRVSPTSRRNH